jgi:hypothetical protein
MNIQFGKPFLRIENLTAPPIRLGEQTLIPLTQVVRLALPGSQVVFSWSRPFGVQLQTASGNQTIIPIRDITRTIQIVLVMICACVGLIAYLLPSRLLNKERHHAE